MNIAFYISSHGYGHAARQQHTVALLTQQRFAVHVRTLAPAKFFPTATSYHAQRYDIGMLQSDPLHYDIAPTADWYAEFIRQEDGLVADELAFIRAENITLILSDMPPIACEIAFRAGIPSVVMSHFLWDWVYEYYVADVPSFAPIVAHITAQYAKATLALQMPFAHPFPQFAQVEPVGLFSNPVTRTRDAVRAEFGIPDGVPMVLLSMGGHGWGRTDITALTQKTDCVFLVMPSAWEQVQSFPQFRVVPMAYDGYHNLIATSDLVVGKAGGSTVAELIANRTPMIYTLANEWRECDLLDGALRQYAQSAFVKLNEFERGDWVGMLDLNVSKRYQGQLPTLNGAQHAVHRIIELFA